MKLVQVRRRSRRVDALVEQNFGPGESLWDPKCFDRLYTLVDGPRLLAVCTLQWSGEYWILGDLCAAEHGKGHGTEIVKRIFKKIFEPVWTDATSPASEGVMRRNGCVRADFGPWPPKGLAYSRGNVVRLVPEGSP